MLLIRYWITSMSLIRKDWLVIVDESHMTFPQVRGMYDGDFSRKQTLSITASDSRPQLTTDP